MSDSAKQVMDIHSSTGINANESDEYQRRWSDERWEKAVRDGRYDRTREHLNFEIARGGVVQPIDRSRSVPDRIRLRLAQLGLRDPNEGNPRKPRRVAARIIFGGNRERMHQLAFGAQKVNVEDKYIDHSHIRRDPAIERWAQDIYRFACDQWGEDNIVGFYVHLDETNPHIHCTVLPIDERGQLSFKKVFCGDSKWEYRQRMLALHDKLARVNKRWGLARGVDIHQSGARHSNPQKFYRDLARQSSDLEAQIADHAFTLSELRYQIKQAEKRVKGLRSMLQNLEDKRSKLEKEIRQLNDLKSQDSSRRNQIAAEIEIKEGELEKVASAIADKEEKLDRANHILSGLQSEIKEQQNKLDAVNQSMSWATKDSAVYAKLRVIEAGFSQMVAEFRNAAKNATSDKELAAFDGSLLNDVAADTNRIVKCATLLFAGYVDQATQFAQGSGGGGGGSDLPWGRKDDEDDRRWAMRCLQRAHAMMRPGSRSVKRK